MKRILQILMLTYLTSLMLIGCAKEKHTPIPKLSFSQKALEYVKLQEGKYLIYKDSASSELDSVIVMESKLDDYFYESPALTWDAATWFGTRSHYGQKFSLVLTKYENASQSPWLIGEAVTVFDAYTAGSADTTSMSLSGSDPDTGAIKVFHFHESTTTNNLIVVEGRTYNDVAITSTTNGSSEGSPYFKSRTYYWAKGIGL